MNSLPDATTIVEAYIIVPRALFGKQSAADGDDDERSCKRAKCEEHDVDNDSIRLSNVTKQSLEAALNADKLSELAVDEVEASHSAASRVYRIHSESQRAKMPKRVLVGQLALPVFVKRQVTLPPPGQSTEANLKTDLDRPVLLVGAGGIGCELLKVMALSGFKHIAVIDLDTIDASNLNRQFLFTSADVGMPKALTARAAVLRWFETRARDFPQFAGESWAAPPTITAYHDNVKDETKFSESFFKGFAAVLNALDNVSARKHVNRLCMKVGVPLFESGTMGYNGQVQPILKGQFECYDCQPKPADQKTFAVCTIHARPTTMVHCVHFAKELYETLFGERSLVRASYPQCTAHEGDTITPDGAGEPAAPGTDAGELTYLVDLVKGWLNSGTDRHSGDALSSQSLLNFGAILARCLFHEKIEQLLAMKSSWSTKPPVALDLSLLERVTQSEAVSSVEGVKRISRDVRLSQEDDIRLFLSSVAACCRRSAAPSEGLTPFKKEDDLAVDFVASTANLRAETFHIAKGSVEELRTVAGAIVPAIATTNAIVAAGVVQQLLQYYRSLSSSCPSLGNRMIYVRKVPLTKRRRTCASPLLFGTADVEASSLPLSAQGKGNGPTVSDRFLLFSVAPNAPNKDCLVCSRDSPPTVFVTVNALSSATLGEFVKVALEGELGMRSPSVVVDSRIVYEEEDYEELMDRPLSAFGAQEVSFLVDALNKDVEWCVVVRPSAGTTGPVSRNHSTFVVTGLDEALSVEAAASAEKEKAKAEEDAKNEEKGRAELLLSHTEGELSVGGAADNAIELGDDDDDDGNEKPKPSDGALGSALEDGSEAVVEID